MRRRLRFLGLAAVTLATGACDLREPFPRTNPFDPDAEVEITLLAPDSTHAVGERITVTVQSSMPLPPGPLAITWRSSNPSLLTSLGNGDYLVLNATTTYVPVTVVADFAGTLYSRVVYVGRRVTP